MARRLWAIAALLGLLAPVALQAQLDILSNRYDPQRTGANLRETTLTASNVSVDRFGKLYSYPVDGSVYAQPLYVSGVTINGTVRNVLYVATMNDQVYAFDADSASPTPLWKRSFINPPSVTPVPITDIVAPDLNVVGNIGIQSTPVIDKPSGTLYFVARTKEGDSYVQRLHALDIATGAARPGSPATIGGSVPGTAPDATPGPNGSFITFDPKVHLQRAGLALVNGVVLVAWASHEDIVPSHGWIMGFDASTLGVVGRFVTSPDGYNGGIWQGGRAPTVDSTGHVYFATANGPWDGTRNFGNSLLKFSVSRTGLSLVDYFTPGNEVQLSAADDDLSGSGFTLLPGTNRLLGGGKEGLLYLLDAANLGRKVAYDKQIVQKVNVGGGHVMGGPVYWSSPGAGPLVYNWSEDDELKAYAVTNGRLVTPPYVRGAMVSPGHPGGSLTLSANGSTANSGVLWASIPTSRDGKHGLVAGVLRAFHAETLAEIWTSEQNATRDRVGTLMKFVPPVVANGRVYLPNHTGAVNVYGLLPVADFTVSVSPGSRVVAPGASAAFSVAVGAQNGFSGRVDLSASGQPQGTTVTFNPQFVSGSGVSTMTVAVPADAAEGTFQVTVTATSGTRTRSTRASVTVRKSVVGTGAIGINFVGSGTTSMAVAEVAGVVPTAGWNNATGAARSTPLALQDDTGASTGATVVWQANGTWATPITDAAGNRRMMRGYLDSTSTSSVSLTVAGLAPRTYDVYVYADGANSTYTRTAAYTISGPGITSATTTLTDAASTNFSSSFVQARNSVGNYVKYTVTGSEFTLTAVPTEPASATRRAPVNAVQIVPAVRAAIGVSFLGTTTTPMAADEIAGVVAAARWNNASGATRTTPLSLVDESGIASGATITWTAASIWALPVTDAPGSRRMMRGYLDTTSTSTTTLSVQGLPSGSCDVYVYVDGANSIYARTAAYTISGPGITTRTITATDPASTNFSSTFTQASDSAGNYVKFTVAASGFTLTAQPVSGGNTTLRAPINGLQIVPVP